MFSKQEARETILGRGSAGQGAWGPPLWVAASLALLPWWLPEAWSHAIFVARWPWWAAGAGIGLLVLAMGGLAGRPLGVSGGYVDACGALADAGCRRSWRLPFLGGIVAGGVLAGWAAGSEPLWDAGPLDALLGEGFSMGKLAWFAVGGVLVGFGARLAGGCTSGHGILGVARMARPSLVATALFMAGGVLVTNLLFGGE